MSKIAGTTNAQTTFLRAFRTAPGGPTPDQWPSATILRRWLRRPAFVRAIASVRDALRFQADFHLASAATAASATLAGPNPPESTPEVHRLSNLLRLAHLRDRFASQSAPTATAPESDDCEDSDNCEDAGDSDHHEEQYDIHRPDICKRITEPLNLNS
ncbi:MAG: hypothetical protein ACHRHE_19090 [Tepidisphaerales bacterium]